MLLSLWISSANSYMISMIGHSRSFFGELQLLIWMDELFSHSKGWRGIASGICITSLKMIQCSNLLAENHNDHHGTNWPPFLSGMVKTQP